MTEEERQRSNDIATTALLFNTQINMLKANGADAKLLESTKKRVVMALGGALETTEGKAEPKEHELKIKPIWFDEMVFGNKDFEIRKNDRGFAEGDKLLMREWDGEEYTGNYITAKIKYIFHASDFSALEEGYCILGLDDIEGVIQGNRV